MDVSKNNIQIIFMLLKLTTYFQGKINPTDSTNGEKRYAVILINYFKVDILDTAEVKMATYSTKKLKDLN